jgi:Cu/Ag efflux protein CusF
MHIKHRIANVVTFSSIAVAIAACANAGGLGSILGGVLGGGGGQQLTGTVQTVDTRNQQISISQQNGQAVAVQYDQNTKVVYQNRLYSITSLDPGDQIAARIQTTQSNTYYTDSIAVTVPANTGSSGGTIGSTTETVQQLAGTVRSIDRTNGRFTIDASSNVSLTVTMPYRASSTDQNRFNNMRVGDYVRFSGVYLNNSLVELRGFY